MFVLSTIADLIRIKPSELRKPIEEAIEDNLNGKFANRVIQNVGLCICLWDILKASEGLIGQGDGYINVNIEFRMVVFRPFKGEIIQGVILDSSQPDGIRVGLDFFGDVWVPASGLPPGCKLLKVPDETPVWIWNPSAEEGNADEAADLPPIAKDPAALADAMEDDSVPIGADPTTATGGEGEGEEQDYSAAFYFDRNEVVRFRVEDERWHDASPEKPKVEVVESSDPANPAATLNRSGGSGVNGQMTEEDEKKRVMRRPVPYAIWASMAAPGLGCVSWWREGAGGEEQEEQEEADGGAMEE